MHRQYLLLRLALHRDESVVGGNIRIRRNAKWYTESSFEHYFLSVFTFAVKLSGKHLDDDDDDDVGLCLQLKFENSY